MKTLPKNITESLFVWIGSVITFFVALFIITSDKITKFDESLNGILGLVATVAFLVGIISFITFVISSVKFLFEKHQLRKKNLLVKVLRVVLTIALLPLSLARELKPFKLVKEIRERRLIPTKRRHALRDLGFTALLILFLVPLWGSGYFIAGYVPSYMMGFITEPIPIAGTGSMYPTFPKGTEGKAQKELGEEIVSTPGMLPYPNGLTIFNIKLFGHEIERGDIVVVENEKIKELTKKLYGESSGWVKRVVALPGDRLELRDGIVYINKSPLKEQYTAKPQSTFGQGFLTECKEITVPADSLFIMGDNRKGSGDSREIGFVKYEDVQYVIPLDRQKGTLDKSWRDTSKDFEESSKIKLDKEKYLELLNNERAKAGLKLLKYEKKLEVSAKLRGENILKYDDFSYEATKSGYTQLRAMNAASYYNIIWNEGIVQGNYEAEELIEYLFEFPDWKKNLLEDKDFQDFGIASVQGEMNGCPTEVIIQHFAGYVPPNYSKDVIESWEKTLNSLKEVQPGWQRLKENTSFYNKYKGDIDKINELISLRVSKLETVVSTMKANKWLSSDLDSYTRTGDKALFDDIDALATKLNNSD